MDFRYLAEAFILGLIGGAIPGPLLTTVFTEILQTRFQKSIRIVIEAMIIEMVVAYTCLLALTAIPLPNYFFNILSIVGAVVLIDLAIKIWKINVFDTSTRMVFSFKKVATFVLANGTLWTFWLTVLIPKAVEYNKLSYLGSVQYIGTVQLGVLVSTLTLGFIFSRFRNLLRRPTVVPYLFKIFSSAFVYFALRMIYSSIVALFLSN